MIVLSFLLSQSDQLLPPIKGRILIHILHINTKNEPLSSLWGIVYYSILICEILFCKLLILHFIIVHNLWGPSKFHCDWNWILNHQMPGNEVTPWFTTYYTKYTLPTTGDTYIYISELIRIYTSWYKSVQYILWEVHYVHIQYTKIYLHVSNMNIHIEISTPFIGFSGTTEMIL